MPKQINLILMEEPDFQKWVSPVELGQSDHFGPGSLLIDIMLTCVSENTQKWVLFSEQGSDLS